jgi:hypothetical protein
MEIYHWHHVIPKHAGGTDDPSNLVRVTREQHAEIHRQRWLSLGDYYDCCAANLLSGDWTVEQARREAARHGQQLSEKFLPAVIQNINEYNSRPFEERSINAKTANSKQSKEGKAKGGSSTGSMPYWTNGLNNKRSHTCPGVGYVLGKLPHGSIKQPRRKCPHCELVTSPGALIQHVKHKHS